MTGLRYAVVTPARNEEDNLRRLGAALIGQTVAPAEWLVVDDGSTDATAEVVAHLATGHGWIRALERPAADRAAPLADGRRLARDLDGFVHGARSLTTAVDVVVKVDADVDFDADHFARLLDRFAADPLLAIASGSCHERQDGAWVRRTKLESTVWGAARAYRIDCLPDVFALECCMGWDGLDELSVQLRGLRTQAFVDLPFRHHRPEGGRERSSRHQGEALGRASWYMGYRPSYLTLRALYRSRREPAALAMLWGYAAAAARRAPRCPNEPIVQSLRERQRLTVTLRRGAPTS